MRQISSEDGAYWWCKSIKMSKSFKSLKPRFFTQYKGAEYKKVVKMMSKMKMYPLRTSHAFHPRALPLANLIALFSQFKKNGNIRSHSI